MDLTTFASLVVLIAGVYVVAGLGFCILLFAKGLSNIDAKAQSSGLGFKLLIIPGIVAFWPVLLRNWKGKKPS